MEAELATLAAERNAERAELRAGLEAGRAERLRLEAIAQEAESQRHQIEVALEEKTQALRGELAAQTAALEQAVTEWRRLHSTLQMRDIAQQALISERASERQKHQHALVQALAEQERLINQVADQQVEVTAMVEEVHASSHLTAAGRFALDIGRDLRQLLDEIDGHAKALLAEYPVDGPVRRGLEALRAEALRAASLGRQFLQAAGRQPSLLTAEAPFATTHATTQRRM